MRQKIGIFRGEGKDEFITFRGNLDYEAEGSDYGHIEVSRYWESDDEQDECDKDWEEFEKGFKGGAPDNIAITEQLN